MKICFVIVLALFLFAGPAAPGNRVERFVKSDMPLILDGNWLKPENGGYTIVMTDEYMTVNGYEYVREEAKPSDVLAIPSREKDFLGWIAKTAVKQAEQVMMEGGNKKDAYEHMKQVFVEHADGKQFWFETNKHRDFVLHHKNYPGPLIVGVPPRPRPECEKPTYRERVIEGRFKHLVSSLERGCLVMRGTGSPVYWAFPQEEAEQIERELKTIGTKAQKTKINGVIQYQPTTIGGRYLLSHADIDVLMNPRDLKKR